MNLTELLTDIIENQKVSKEEILNKLDVFLLVNRITKDEYKEFVSLVGSIYK